MSRHYLVQLTGEDDFYQHTSVLVEVSDKHAYDDAIKLALEQHDADWVIDVIADDVNVEDVYMISKTADHVINL